MLTASVVAYHHSLVEIRKVVDCILAEPVDILYIIDNSSDDNLSEVGRISERIRYIHSGKNLGYGVGHNIAIREAIKQGGAYHVVINPDIYFDKGVIVALRNYMDRHKKIGLVMPKVMYPNGEIQYLCKLLPTPWDLFVRRFFLWSRWVEKSNYRYELRFSGYNEIMQVPSLSGCFMFLRVEVLKQVKGFDEHYFMYVEDLDLCRRIGQVAETVYCPFVNIYHKYEKGSYKSRKLLKYHIKSTFRYFNEWGWFFDEERKRINRSVLKELGYRKK